MKNAIIFIIALAVSNLALAESPAQIYGKYSAPFGLEWGMSKEKLATMGVKLTPDDAVKDAYLATTLPKNLSDGEEYFLNFKQGFGLVRVGAFTSPFIGDWYGSKGKERYSQLKAAMVNKYGKAKREYEWTGGARIYEDSDQFYECLLYDGCGHWASVWGNDTDGKIILEITGARPGAGFVTLIYSSAAWFVAREQEKEEKSRSDEDAL